MNFDTMQRLMAAYPQLKRQQATLEALEEGAWCCHGSWGVGCIQSVDTENSRIVIQFESQAEPKSMDLAFCLQKLQVLPETHIIVEVRKDPKAAERLLKTDPSEWVVKALQSFPDRQASPLALEALLRQALEPLFKPAAFKYWWSSVQKALLQNPLICVPRNKTGVFALRAEPISREHELLDALLSAKQAAQKITLGMQLCQLPCLEDIRKELPSVLEIISPLSKNTQLSPAQRLEACWICSDIARTIDADAELTQVTSQREKVINSISAELELKNTQEAINKAQAKVDRLEKEEIGASITSPVDGRVTSLTYSAGETTAADAEAAVIQIQGKKLSVSFSVKKEQAQKLKVGDEAEPQNPWEYNDDFHAVLRQIAADQSDPQNSRILKFEIDSDSVSQGDNVQLQIAESSKTYDLVVPNSAVRSDSNGTFVLVLQTRQSPMGNRYIVSRESVKVLAKDDTNSAISGAIGAYSYVVTESTKMISSGDQVRLADEVEREDQ